MNCSTSSDTNELAGILSLRVLAARDLQAVTPSSLLRWRSASANPYCRVQFGDNFHFTSVINDSLNPSWDKEHCNFEVPLPRECDILSYDMKGSKGRFGRRAYAYNPQFPQIYVKIMHKSTDDSEDKFIGKAIIDTLPAIFSDASSFKQWFPIYNDAIQTTGEVLLSFQYDPCGLDPHHGDTIRVIGFGGSQCYSKLLSLDQVLEVRNVRGDKVLASYKSNEDWDVVLELHRNIIYVSHRPNILVSAQTTLNTQVSRIRQTALVARMEQMFRQLPSKRRHQLMEGKKFLEITADEIINCGRKILGDLQENGISFSLSKSIDHGYACVVSVVDAFLLIDWNERNTRLERNPLIESDNSMLLKNEDNVQEISADLNDCPPQLICPITGCPMLDPVVASDGHSYEKKAILQWFKNHNTSPLTGAVMATTQIFPNHTLKQLSEEFMENQFSNESKTQKL